MASAGCLRCLKSGSWMPISRIQRNPDFVVLAALQIVRLEVVQTDMLDVVDQLNSTLLDKPFASAYSSQGRTSCKPIAPKTKQLTGLGKAHKPQSSSCNKPSAHLQLLVQTCFTTPFQTNKMWLYHSCSIRHKLAAHHPYQQHIWTSKLCSRPPKRSKQVLLGEGYYAERTSKQTIKILKRRGKDLESQIETPNAIIKDLKFEASFFDETAIEAAEGIVEIGEDYVEEAFNEDDATTGDVRMLLTDRWVPPPVRIHLHANKGRAK